jgi:hypothetical protein
MSMSCKECRRWVSIKVDGERVPFSVAGRLEEHLGACGPCRDLLSRESRRSAVLGTALRAPDPGRLEAAIREGLAVEGIPGARVPYAFSRSRLALQVAAAVLLLAVGGWLAFRGRGPEGADPAPAGAARTARITFEIDQSIDDVISGSDGSPVGRKTRQVRQLIWDRDAPEAADPGRARAPEPVRLDKARTEYIRLVDFPYW